MQNYTDLIGNDNCSGIREVAKDAKKTAKQRPRKTFASVLRALRAFAVSI